MSAWTTKTNSFTARDRHSLSLFLVRMVFAYVPYDEFHPLTTIFQDRNILSPDRLSRNTCHKRSDTYQYVFDNEQYWQAYAKKPSPVIPKHSPWYFFLDRSRHLLPNLQLGFRDILSWLANDYEWNTRHLHRLSYNSVGQWLSQSLLTVIDWTQSLTPMSITSSISPVRRWKRYTLPWSLPVTIVLPPSWKATFLLLRWVQGTENVFSRSVADILYRATPCDTSSRITASSFTLTTAWPLELVIYHQYLGIRAVAYITEPVAFDLRILPLSSSTWLKNLAWVVLSFLFGFHSHNTVIPSKTPELWSPNPCLPERNGLRPVFRDSHRFYDHRFHHRVNDKAMDGFRSVDYCKLARACIVCDSRYLLTILPARQATTKNLDKLGAV